MVSDSPDSRQRILLVTGMLGAGKTTALRVLEYLGWEAIDKFPIRLLDRLNGDPPET
ncbi:MAG: RNase adapter RapZ, partial [Novosphingobium sp.]